MGRYHGEDSDFVKVRVRGLFPSASDTQFISASIVDEAQKRHISLLILELANDYWCRSSVDWWRYIRNRNATRLFNEVLGNHRKE